MSYDWKFLSDQVASTMQPTGVHEWKRVPLHALFPQLEGVSLATYWKLRLACCGHLIVEGEEKLVNCDRCHNNSGFVCPLCKGATWLSTQGEYPYMERCPGCTVETFDERGKVVRVYNSAKELLTAQHWLMHHFPYGVPKEPTETDLARMAMY